MSTTARGYGRAEWDAAATARELVWYTQPHTLGAEEDLDAAVGLLKRVQAGKLGPTIRLYRPEPTLAFGQRDVRLPGYERARQICYEHGYTPVVRKAGGRAAAYHPGSLVLDHLEPHSDAISGALPRFRLFGELIARAFTRAGVPAAMGEIEGEYCAGEYSIHGVDPRGEDFHIKLVGTAQRVIAGAWLFSSSIVVEDSAPIRAVLTDVYAALELDWRPATAGAAEDLVPGITVKDMAQALQDEYRDHVTVVPGSWQDLGL
ncbi:lipoate--protein ligase family protein [Micrococcoides hystricis]|uniref:Biotin/lipoate A/B protein ligase family protein n=1 Tax=Micrococcoides hystricis TaxID=1572761 RepID=A0ABV6P9N9_9MICC